ncbi:PH domain-containing protein [Neobacillus fumarioli]|uniref:PH domain-containing protein n=1 Tax=Neobacillus fumarioli TaxID=105229 RepID=UPI00082EA399|nr:PH domain-containing protein [Neobacillus fumarioli]
MQLNKQTIALIHNDLDGNEEVLLSLSGKTAPSNPMLKFLPEVSWLTKENMPILFVLTNHRILVYRSPVYQSITFSYSINLTEISTFKDISGPLNGGIQFTLKDNQTYKFIFKKHRINEIITHLQNKALNS